MQSRFDTLRIDTPGHPQRERPYNLDDMKNTNDISQIDTETLLQMETKEAKKYYIGLVGNYSDNDETRFLLTPEACGLICSAGVNIIMESGAAVDISFTDETYAEYGVKIGTREEALQADIVLSYLPLKATGIKKMKKGATLLCMMDNSFFDKEIITALLENNITCGCFDNMLSYNDEPVFNNIIEEINGRAAIMYAQEALSYLGEGKGVLLAGVAGINPCEVLVIGDGVDVYAAASSAISAGASVTLLNNDISALMKAKYLCGHQLNTIAIHPKVLYNKVKTADVIIVGSCTRPFEIPKKLNVVMKESVYLLDLKKSHPSVSVPRTVAMAISNVLVNFFNEMVIKEGFHGMLSTTPGVRCGIVTYHGKLVDKLVASYLAMPCVDINMLLAATN